MTPNLQSPQSDSTPWTLTLNSSEVIWSQKMSGKMGHFGNFSDWAGMAVPCKSCPQEFLTVIKYLVFLCVPINP